MVVALLVLAWTGSTTGRDGGQDTQGAMARLLSGHVRPTGRCMPGPGRADSSIPRHQASHASSQTTTGHQTPGSMTECHTIHPPLSATDHHAAAGRERQIITQPRSM